MRILLTLHNFLPEQMLGTENVAIGQMREMLRAGHQLALFYAGNAPPAPGELAALGLEGIALFRVPYRPTKAQVLLSIRKPHVERAFLTALRTFQPDAAVFHHLVRLSLQLPVLAAYAGIPAAYFLHDYYWLCPSYSLFAWDADVCPGGSPWRCAACLHASRYGRAGPRVLLCLGALAVWWRNLVVRRVLPTIPLFIAPSAGLVEQMAKRGAALAHTAIVRNGQEPVAAPPALGTPPGPVRFGYIGGVSPKKGLDVLAEAFRGTLGQQLRIRGFPSEAAMAAFRAVHPELEAQLECFDSDRAGFYRSVDVVVVPSVWLENQPLVILESFAHGRPVLASRIGGLQDMFSEGQGGRFFTPGDAQSLRRIATDLAANPLAVVRLAQGIPRWPNWVEVTAEMVRHLELLVQRRRDARSDGWGPVTDSSATADRRSLPQSGSVAGRGAPMISGSATAATLAVSIVTYGGDLDRLGPTFAALAAASEALPGTGCPTMRLFLVDNGPLDAARSATLAGLVGTLGGRAEAIAGHGNVGYGRGHNLAIARSAGDYHLVLNPDVELAPDALARALAFMNAHPDCGLLAPEVSNESGDLQYLCKRYPTLFDLLLRGFAPRCVRKRFRARLDRYEMRDLINRRDVVWDPPIVSGCFMLFRTEVLKALGGFDPRYFLYFEDFDLSLRAARLARLAYVPQVRMVHHGGGAARKGPAHVWMFVSSAAKFFARHGWRRA